jgi:16S rRNA (cytosine1402-N4)-methyltransferase
VTLVHRNFRVLGEVAERTGFRAVDGVLLDLGISSAQLEASGRGFTFAGDEPLDLRLDPTTGPTAADIIAEAPRAEIEQILRRFGEEPRAGTIAARIEAARALKPITTTRQLVALIPWTRDRDRRRIHPATRTFQALRIAVNDELGALAEVLPQALAALRRGGRLAVISFHSLEDRIVKTFFRQRAGLISDLVDPKLPVRPSTQPPELRILTRRPVVRSPEEIARNRRSRSARLRVAERL